MKQRLLLAFSALLMALAGTLLGQDSEGVEPPWSGSLGVAYLATTGNAETSTFGIDFALARRPLPWGFETFASLQRSKDDGVVTAERYLAGARAVRSLSEAWSVFAGFSLENNEFEGLDLRWLIDSGVTWNALRGPVHLLNLDLGLTWTDEDRVPGQEDVDFLGATLGLGYEWKLSDTASLTEELAYYPNFDESTNWRVTSETALKAQILKSLALQLSYEIRYRNLPIGDAEDTDTTAKASVVWGF